jgi:hypothetical protein
VQADPVQGDVQPIGERGDGEVGLEAAFDEARPDGERPNRVGQRAEPQLAPFEQLTVDVLELPEGRVDP